MRLRNVCSTCSTCRGLILWYIAKLIFLSETCHPCAFLGTHKILFILHRAASALNCRVAVDFSIIVWAFGKIPVVTTTWLMMMVYTLTVFPLIQAWIINQKSWIPLPNSLWILCYGIYMAVFAYFPVVEIIQRDLPTASTIIVVCEQVRFELCDSERRNSYHQIFFLFRKTAFWLRLPRVCVVFSKSNLEPSDYRDTFDPRSEEANPVGYLFTTSLAF